MTEEIRCPKCNCIVPKERYELLGVVTCTKHTLQPEIYGVMEYSSKNLADLVICTSRRELEQFRKPANRRR